MVSCGDAAGLIDPISGEGLTAALVSGKRAGEAVASFLSGEPGALTNTADGFETGARLATRRPFENRVFAAWVGLAPAERQLFALLAGLGPGASGVVRRARAMGRAGIVSGEYLP